MLDSSSAYAKMLLIQKQLRLHVPTALEACNSFASPARLRPPERAALAEIVASCIARAASLECKKPETQSHTCMATAELSIA